MIGNIFTCELVVLTGVVLLSFLTENSKFEHLLKIIAALDIIGGCITACCGIWLGFN